MPCIIPERFNLAQVGLVNTHYVYLPLAAGKVRGLALRRTTDSTGRP